MIKIEINTIEDIAKKFVKRIEQSIEPTFDFSDDKDFSDSADELHKRVHKLYLCKPELLECENDRFENDVAKNSWNTDPFFNYERTIYKKGEDDTKHNYWLMKCRFR